MLLLLGHTCCCCSRSLSLSFTRAISRHWRDVITSHSLGPTSTLSLKRIQQLPMLHPRDTEQ
jgi:hypothetical protein